MVVGAALVAGRSLARCVEFHPLPLAGRVAKLVRSSLGMDVVRHPLPGDLAKLLRQGIRVGVLKFVNAGELLLDNLL